MLTKAIEVNRHRDRKAKWSVVKGIDVIATDRYGGQKRKETIGIVVTGD